MLAYEWLAAWTSSSSSTDQLPRSTVAGGGAGEVPATCRVGGADPFAGSSARSSGRATVCGPAERPAGAVGPGLTPDRERSGAPVGLGFASEVPPLETAIEGRTSTVTPSSSTLAVVPSGTVIVVVP